MQNFAEILNKTSDARFFCLRSLWAGGWRSSRGASATALSRGASATALSRGAGHSSKTARGEVEIFPVEQHTGSAGCAVNTGAASGGAVWGEPQAA